MAKAKTEKAKAVAETVKPEEVFVPETQEAPVEQQAEVSGCPVESLVSSVESAIGALSSIQKGHRELDVTVSDLNKLFERVHALTKFIVSTKAELDKKKR